MATDNTLVLESPHSKSRITLECLQDIEKFHGIDVLKESLYQLYLSVIEPDKFGMTLEVKNELKIYLKK